MKLAVQVTLWYLLINPFYTQETQALPTQHNHIWEECFSDHFDLGCATLAISLLAYTAYIASPDITIQTAIHRLEDGVFYDDFLEYKEYDYLEQTNEDTSQAGLKNKEEKEKEFFNNNITIYYPAREQQQVKGDIEKIATYTDRKILHIHERKLHTNTQQIELLFEQARAIAPCIIYIEKDLGDENKFRKKLNTSNPSYQCIELFIQKVKECNNNNIPILIFGYSADKMASITPEDFDILGFNMKQENPSYQERLEFLKLLLAKTDLNVNFKMENIAKKTMGFTYLQLALLVNKAKTSQIKENSTTLDNHYINAACGAIISSHDIRQRSKKDIHRTAVHEMGHAIITAHFQDDIQLNNAAITPQKYMEYIEQYGLEEVLQNGRIYSQIKPYYLYNKINVYKENIMVDLAGKCAEQIFFQLTTNKDFNYKNSFYEFMNNPQGAYSDLQNAKKRAQQVIQLIKEENNGICRYLTDETLLMELYTSTIDLIMLYQDQIALLAEELEDKEYLHGSEIYAQFKRITI